MNDEGQKWFEARRRELLPVPYFHVVFTVPKELNRIVRSHQQALYPALMQAAARTLLEVAAAPESLGGTPGVMAALHTWSSTLIYHLHVHCLLPAGAVDEHGEWRAAKGPRLAPESVLAKAFQAKLRGMMNAAVQDLELPEAAFNTVWQVHVEQPQHGSETVLRYLGHSLHRGPLSDYSILEVTDKDVVFKYRAGDRRKWRTMTLAGHEFLRRFLQHVWPDRVHKVRYSGLWSRKYRVQLEAIRQQLLAAEPVASTSAPDSAATATSVVAQSESSSPHWLQCPHCRGQRVIVSRFGPGETPPLRPRPLAASPPAQPP
jgi:Putative transposase